MVSKIKTYFSMQAEMHRSMVSRWRDRRRRRALGLPEFPSVDEVLSAPYCFVLSTGRCGTAFLTEMLRQSPRLSVRHTPKPELEYVSSLVHRLKPGPEALELAILAARFESFVAAYRSGLIYVETNNRISFFAPALARLLPNARFIHLVRHPADFVRSGMRRGYYSERVVQHQRLAPTDPVDWSSWTQLEKIAWEWNEINGAIEKFKATVQADRVMTIRSEALFQNSQVLTSIMEFIGVADDERLSRMTKSKILKPVNEQREGSFSRYEHWSDADKAALKRIATLASVYEYDCV